MSGASTQLGRHRPRPRRRRRRAASRRVAAVRRCAGDRVEQLPESQLQDYFYDVVGEKEDAAAPLGRILIACAAADPDGRRAIRQQFEQRLTDDDLPPALARCLTRRLRATAPDELIAQLIRDSAGEDSARAAAAQRRLRTLGQPAAVSCGAGGAPQGTPS